MSKNRKIPLGSPVIIDTLKGKYDLKNESNKEIAFMPEGVVTAYINEISDQFLIIRLRSNIEIKVSEKELSECTKNFYFSENKSQFALLKFIKYFFKAEFILSGNRKMKDLFNPFTFFRWINYTIKDIF